MCGLSYGGYFVSPVRGLWSTRGVCVCVVRREVRFVFVICCSRVSCSRG